MKNPDTTVFSKTLQTLALVLVSVILTACGDDYPREWPAIPHVWNGGCPALAGTWLINPQEHAGIAGPGFKDSFFREAMGDDSEVWPWETMTISGDPAKEMTVTLERSPATLSAWQKWYLEKSPQDSTAFERYHSAAYRWSEDNWGLSDEEYQAMLDKQYLPVSHRTMFRMTENYRCDGGWLVSKRRVPNTDPDSSIEEVTDGEVRFTLDPQGALVADSQSRRGRQLTIWCRGDDNCWHLPFGIGTSHEWRHWLPGKQPAPDRLMRPWTGSFSADAYMINRTGEPGAAERLAEFRAALTSILPSSVTISSITPAGSSVVALVESPDSASLSALLKAVKADNRFRDRLVRSLDAATPGHLRMEVVVGMFPRPSDTPVSSIELGIRGLLPSGASLQKVEPDMGGFRVSVHSTDDGVIHETARAIQESSRFKNVRVETWFTSGEDRDLVIRVEEQN